MRRGPVNGVNIWKDWAALCAWFSVKAIGETSSFTGVSLAISFMERRARMSACRRRRISLPVLDTDTSTSLYHSSTLLRRGAGSGTGTLGDSRFIGVVFKFDLLVDFRRKRIFRCDCFRTSSSFLIDKASRSNSFSRRSCSFSR